MLAKTLPSVVEKVLGGNLPNMLRTVPGTEQNIHQGSFINTILQAVNPTSKRKLPPDPHPLQIPMRRPSLESSFRVGGTATARPPEAAHCPALGGRSLTGPLAHSSIITVDDASHRVKRAPRFQHKTPQLLPGAGARFTPAHYAPGERPCSSPCHFPLSRHTLPPPSRACLTGGSRQKVDSKQPPSIAGLMPALQAVTVCPERK